MVRSHHQFSGYEFEQTPADSEGQGNLVCCSSWGRKESDTTWQLNNNNNNKNNTHADQERGKKPDDAGNREE